MTKTALVIGAGSGIGTALVDRLADHPSFDKVVAVTRRPVSPTADRVAWLNLDILAQESASVTRTLATQCENVHALFVTCGVLHDASGGPEKAIAALDAERAQRVYATNAVLPLKALAAALPLLSHPEPSTAIVLSAKVGSIEDNRVGGWYSYRMAKAALNMGVKTLAIEAGRRRHHPIITAVHPGTTKTPLSNPFLGSKHPHVDPVVTAERLIALGLDADPDRHGAFVHWDGTQLPW